MRDERPPHDDHDAILKRVADLEAQLAAVPASSELEARVAQRTAELNATNEALLAASRAKDEFLASMSHELRTPLNVVLGLTEALTEGVYGAVSREQERVLARIDDSGRHLLALINDLLDISRIGAGQLALDVEEVSVDEVCRASLRLLRDAAEKKQITVAYAIAERFSTIEADARRLRQILVNLLSNAVKFTADGGRVGLDVYPDPETGGTAFVVWDTGIGMAQEDVPRLFEPFVQLDARLARAHEGTGLGLALVSRLTGLHGGTVRVATRKGEGSRFTVSIPGRRGSVAPDQRASHAPEHREG